MEEEEDLNISWESLMKKLLKKLMKESKVYCLASNHKSREEILSKHSQFQILLFMKVLNAKDAFQSLLLESDINVWFALSLTYVKYVRVALSMNIIF